MTDTPIGDFDLLIASVALTELILRNPVSQELPGFCSLDQIRKTYT